MLYDVDFLISISTVSYYAMRVCANELLLCFRTMSYSYHITHFQPFIYGYIFAVARSFQAKSQVKIDQQN